MSSLIKFSNFTLYSSIAYLSSYFGDPTTTTTSAGPEVIRCVGSIFVVPISLALCSGADRAGTHRGIYLQSLAVYLLAIAVLISITIFQHSEQLTTFTDDDGDSLTTIQTSNATTRNQTIFGGGSSMMIAHLSVVSILIVAMTFCVQLLEFFSINLTKKQAQEAISYGSLRMFGSLGGLVSTMVLPLFPAHNQTRATYLLALLLLVASLSMGALNLILACLLPNKEPYVAGQYNSDDDSHESYEIDDGTKFNFTQHIWASRWAESECGLDLRLASIFVDSRQPVKTLKASERRQFDTREEDVYRNIRRCSLAPLGDSFLVKQFELDHKNVRHFNFVTNVQPLEKASMADKNFMPSIEYSLKSENSSLGKGSLIKGSNSLAEFARPTTDLTVGIQLSLMKDLASRSNSFNRFLCSLAIVGFILAFRPARSNSMDELGQLRLMTDETIVIASILGHICEIMFYCGANRVAQIVSHESSLIPIALIHTFGMISAHLANHLNMMDFVAPLMTAILGSLCAAWLNCALVELALELASESRFSIPELTRTRELRCDEDCKDQVRNGLKATIVCLFYNSTYAIGGTLGSTLSSSLRDFYGAEMISLLNIGLTIAFIIVALLMHKYQF